MSDIETELKLLLDEQAAAALATAELGDGEPEDLVSIYYDTPDYDLRRRGWAVRLRNTADGWVQTAKSGGAGLSRTEIERPVASARLDPEALGGGTLRKLIGERMEALVPAFETRIHRRAAIVEADGARIELALDQGEILAGATREDVLEVELELLEGAPEALFGLAERLGAHGALRPSLLSKGARGYALAAGRARAPMRFQAPALDQDGPAREGFEALASAALAQLAANAELVRRGLSLEAVHQARVGLRRLRVTLGAFKAMLADAERDDVADELARMTALFADARTLDVFIAETFQPLARHAPGAARLGEALHRAREAAHARAQAAAAEPEFAVGMLRVMRWIACGAWSRDPVTAPLGERPLRAVAREILAHRRKVLLKRGRKLDWSDPIARHRLRIQAKKMRYLLEAFAPEAPMLKPLKRMQSALGALNDIHTAPDTVRLLDDHLAARDGVLALGVVIGMRRAEEPALLHAAKAELKAFARAEP